jgi:hypothetical protein
MRRSIPWILLGVASCALARDVTYKPPTSGDLATIKISAAGYTGGGLLSTASLSLLVQRVERVKRHCDPETLGWIDYKSPDATYAITAGKIGSFGIQHKRQTLTKGNSGQATFAFIPERDHVYTLEVGVREEALDVKVFDETSGHTPVTTEMHYLMICARQNAEEIGL